MPKLQIIKADYHNAEQGQHILELLDHYARDDMGGGEPLAEQVRATLIEQLSQLTTAASFIGYLENRPVGLANCFFGFSTFRAAPLLNVHDLVVHQSCRGLGISQRLLDQVEQYAAANGCCKVTLEVLTGNAVALAAYHKFGFRQYQLDPRKGSAVFLEKAVSGAQ